MQCPFCDATISYAAHRCPNCARLLPRQETPPTPKVVTSPRLPQKISLIPLGSVPPTDSPPSPPRDSDVSPPPLAPAGEEQITPTGEHLNQLVLSSVKRFHRQEHIIAGGTISLVVLTILSIVLFGIIHQHQQAPTPINAAVAPTNDAATPIPNAPATPSPSATTATPQGTGTSAPTLTIGASHPQPTPTSPTSTAAPVSTATIAPTPTIAPTCSGAALDRSSWGVSASSTGNGYTTAEAIDNNTGTFWTVGDAQVSGMWFQVDLGSSQRLCKLTLLNNQPSTIADYPRGYQVFVSSDGQNWGNAIASGAGNSGTTVIAFTPQTARYVKIVETVNESPFWWSIDELNMYQ